MIGGASEGTRGAVAALGAYLIWGLFPLYFNTLAALPPVEVLANGVIGSAIFSFAVLAFTGGLGAVRSVAADWRQLRPLVASSLALGLNWGLFIWAVTHGRALECSMGYFIFPLVSLVLACVVLGERVSRRRQAAIAVMTLGVVWLVFSGQGFPWVALTLAASFGAYGLLRKTTPVPELAGLLIETAILSPFAALYLVSQGGGVGFSVGAGTAGLLLLAGPVTAIPLWLFAYGARRLSLSTVGLMMYLNPAIQMLTAVFVFHEAFTVVHGVAFGAIWTGLALYSWPEGRPVAAHPGGPALSAKP
jgi:chloramphenicol-sensitive protein RarD